MLNLIDYIVIDERTHGLIDSHVIHFEYKRYSFENKERLSENYISNLDLCKEMRDALSAAYNLATAQFIIRTYLKVIMQNH